MTRDFDETSMACLLKLHSTCPFKHLDAIHNFEETINRLIFFQNSKKNFRNLMKKLLLFDKIFATFSKLSLYMS